MRRFRRATSAPATMIERMMKRIAASRAITPAARGVSCIRPGTLHGPMISKDTGRPRHAAALTWIGTLGVDA